MLMLAVDIHQPSPDLGQHGHGTWLMIDIAAVTFLGPIDFALDQDLSAIQKINAFFSR